MAVLLLFLDDERKNDESWQCPFPFQSESSLFLHLLPIMGNELLTGWRCSCYFFRVMMIKYGRIMMTMMVMMMMVMMAMRMMLIVMMVLMLLLAMMMMVIMVMVMMMMMRMMVG